MKHKSLVRHVVLFEADIDGHYDGATLIEFQHERIAEIRMVRRLPKRESINGQL